jgi:hypothetical protein
MRRYRLPVAVAVVVLLVLTAPDPMTAIPVFDVKAFEQRTQQYAQIVAHVGHALATKRLLEAQARHYKYQLRAFSNNFNPSSMINNFLDPCPYAGPWKSVVQGLGKADEAIYKVMSRPEFNPCMAGLKLEEEKREAAAARVEEKFTQEALKQAGASARDQNNMDGTIRELMGLSVDTGEDGRSPTARLQLIAGSNVMIMVQLRDLQRMQQSMLYLATMESLRQNGFRVNAINRHLYRKAHFYQTMTPFVVSGQPRPVDF